MEITRYTVHIVTIMSLKVHIFFENIDFEISIQRPYCPYTVHISNVEPQFFFTFFLFFLTRYWIIFFFLQFFFAIFCNFVAIFSFFSTTFQEILRLYLALFLKKNADLLDVFLEQYKISLFLKSIFCYITTLGTYYGLDQGFILGGEGRKEGLNCSK